MAASPTIEYPQGGWSRDWEEEAQDWRQEMRRRLRLLANVGDDVDRRAVVLAMCKRSFATFVNDWCFTLDPRARPPLKRKLPMVLWPAQVELAQWLERQQATSSSGLIKKSRDLGVTWICALYGLWRWLFYDGEVVTYGSRKVTLVDELGNTSSIIEKVRYALYALPDWFLPPGFSTKTHDNHLRLVNPHNQSVIAGEGGDQMGRGGRSSIYFCDEFAFVPRANKVRSAVGDNADTVIFLSTSNGMGTTFHQMETEGGLPFFRFHWTSDPRKDQEWAAHKAAQIGPTNFAREHEMDDGAALDWIIIPGEWVRAAQEIELPAGSVRRAGCDIADTGEDKTVLAMRQGPVLEPLLAWDDKISSELWTTIGEILTARGVRELYYDRDGVGAGLGATLGVMGVDARIEGIRNGGRPSDVCYSDDPRLPACERFANRAAELWWALRLRFQKSWERSLGMREWPADECISIPADDYELLAQLSSRRYKRTEGGKIALESKKKMKRERGVKSPDRAEAAVYVFAQPLKAAQVDPFDQIERQYGFLGGST